MNCHNCNNKANKNNTFEDELYCDECFDAIPNCEWCALNGDEVKTEYYSDTAKRYMCDECLEGVQACKGCDEWTHSDIGTHLDHDYYDNDGEYVCNNCAKDDDDDDDDDDKNEIGAMLPLMKQHNINFPVRVGILSKSVQEITEAGEDIRDYIINTTDVINNGEELDIWLNANKDKKHITIIPQVI